MIVCGAYNISVHYGAHEVFRDATVEVNEGDRIGIVGLNGSGKTTLLKVLANQIPVVSGRIYWQKNITVGMLEQIPEVESGKSLLDVLQGAFQDLYNIQQEMNQLEALLASNPAEVDSLLKRYGYLQEEFAESNGYEIDARIRRIAAGLQLTDRLDRTWSQLSGGERTRVGLALILLRDPGLLLLDEPTNHLDMEVSEWLAEYIRVFRGTVVMVSHDRYFLDQTVGRIVEVDDGKLVDYNTHYSGYRKEKEEGLLQQFKDYQDQQKKIKKMKEAIARLRDWANRTYPPSDSLNRRASSMEKALERIQLIQRPTLQSRTMKMDLISHQISSEQVFSVVDATKRYDCNLLFTGAQLTVRRGERVAIVGDNGTGKSTLLKMILGIIPLDQGKIIQGSSLSVGYISQHEEQFDPNETVLESFRNCMAVSEQEARHLLARFLFYGDAVFQKTGHLSGGERRRLRWAQVMYGRHNVLVLDEPTNHLDTDSREVLEEALEDYSGTILAVSHDRYLLDRFFQITYWLDHQKLTRYEGNYSYARRSRLNSLEGKSVVKD